MEILSRNTGSFDFTDGCSEATDAELVVLIVLQLIESPASTAITQSLFIDQGVEGFTKITNTLPNRKCLNVKMNEYRELSIVFCGKSVNNSPVNLFYK